MGMMNKFRIFLSWLAGGYYLNVIGIDIKLKFEK
jgi:hypothetical protein